MSRGRNKPYDSLLMNMEDAFDDKQEKPQVTNVP